MRTEKTGGGGRVLDKYIISSLSGRRKLWVGLVIHGKGKMWRRELGWAGWGSEAKKGRLGHLMGMGGKGEPPDPDKEWKVWGRWVKDYRQNGNTDRCTWPLLPGQFPNQRSGSNLNTPSLGKLLWLSVFFPNYKHPVVIRPAMSLFTLVHPVSTAFSFRLNTSKGRDHCLLHLCMPKQGLAHIYTEHLFLMQTWVTWCGTVSTTWSEQGTELLKWGPSWKICTIWWKRAEDALCTKSQRNLIVFILLPFPPHSWVSVFPNMKMHFAEMIHFAKFLQAKQEAACT